MLRVAKAVRLRLARTKTVIRNKVDTIMAYAHWHSKIQLTPVRYPSIKKKLKEPYGHFLAEQ